MPYVRRQSYQKLLPGLKYEPKTAITDGTDRWAIFERFFNQVPPHLTPGGRVFLEIDPQSRNKITHYQQFYLPGFKLEFAKDLASKYRFAVLTKPNI